MPDESNRIRQSVIKAMMEFLLILSVFHRETTLQSVKECHPRIVVVFNNMSKNQEDYAKILERIETYKDMLKEDAIDFYCDYQISDQTKIGDETWHDIKK